MTPDEIIMWCKALGAILSLVAGGVMLIGLVALTVCLLLRAWRGEDDG